MAVLCLIDPLGLRCGLTRLATKRLTTVTLARAIIGAWNKMLFAVAALPARSRSHGGGNAATLAISQFSAEPGPSRRPQLKPKTKKNFLSGRSEKKRLKKIHRQNGHKKSIFNQAESDQFQIGTRTVSIPQRVSSDSADFKWTAACSQRCSPAQYCAWQDGLSIAS